MVAVTAWPKMVELLPPRKLGEAEITHRAGVCTLHVDGVPVMSDTPQEREQAQEFVDNARGHVLVAGLGLGWVLHAVKDKVRSLTVIEKSADVIRLVGHTANCALIGLADIWDWSPGHLRYDTIWLDIWDKSPSGEEVESLKAHVRPWLAPGGWMGAWQQKEVAHGNV